MAHRAVITFAAAHLERDFLRSANVFDNIGNNGGFINRGLADGELALIGQEQTRSSVTVWPASVSRYSTSMVSPGATRYCLLPVSITAYRFSPIKGR